MVSATGFTHGVQTGLETPMLHILTENDNRPNSGTSDTEVSNLPVIFPNITFLLDYQ